MENELIYINYKMRFKNILKKKDNCVWFYQNEIDKWNRYEIDKTDSPITKIKVNNKIYRIWIWIL